MSASIGALDSDRIVSEWTDSVRSLLEELAGWFRDEGWTVRWGSRQITEDDLGTYTIKMLEVQTPDGLLFVEPVARLVGSADGRVDFYAYPTLYRVMLLRRREGGDWWIRTDSGIPVRHPWSRETFVQLGRDLLSAG